MKKEDQSSPQKVTEQATPLDIGLESHYLLKQLISDGFYPSNGGLCWSYIEETTIGQVCGQDIETRIRAIIKREPGNALAGVSNPAAVKEVIQQARLACDNTPYPAWVNLIPLTRALAALGEHEKL